MTYGTIKVDTVTFTNAGVDKSITLSGLVQNPTFSGNVTVTGTLSGVTVTGTTANFTSGNFTNISGGTHTITSGVFAAGSAASPSITFTGDLNTGIYSPGADQVAISTNSSGRLFIDANGNVGINTASTIAPGGFGYAREFALTGATSGDSSAAINIRGSRTVSGGFGDINFWHQSTSNRAYIQARRGSSDSAIDLDFITSGGAGMRITSAGLVGVGTSTPGVALDVNGAIRSNDIFTLFKNGTDAFYIGAGTIITGGASTDVAFRSNQNGSILFSTNGSTERLRITSAGLVGVGTSSPASLLNIKGSAANGFSLTHSNNTVISELYELSGTQGAGLSLKNSSGTTNVFFNAGGDSYINGGKVGIGTSSPSQALSVVGNVTVGDTAQPSISLRCTTNAGNPTLLSSIDSFSTPYGAINARIAFRGGDAGYADLGRITFQTKGFDGLNDRIAIASDGKVGIGTTAPSYALDVRTTGTSISSSFTSDQSEQYIALKDSGTTIGHVRLGSTSGSMLFFAGNGERGRFDSSGRLLVGTSSSRQVNASIAALQLQIEGTTYQSSSMSLVTNQNAADGAYIVLGKSRGTSLGNSTIVSSGDSLGALWFCGADGNTMPRGAIIEAVVDGTPGASDMPGRLVFSTTADGASSPTERLRITSAGLVGIGTSSPSYTLDVATNIRAFTSSFKGGSGSANMLFAVGGNAGELANPVAEIRGYDRYSARNLFDGDLAIHTLSANSSTEKVRIDYLGRLLVGTSSTSVSYTTALLQGSAGDTSAQSILRLARGASTPSSGNALGVIAFSNSAHSDGANIYAARDGGTWSASSLPTALVFSTTPDSGSSPVERMRITAAGNIECNVGSSTQIASILSFTGGQIKQQYRSFGTGSVNIVEFVRDTGGTPTTVGTISTTGSATAYNTSSDYRLKENIEPVSDGIIRLQQLKPSRFNFINSPNAVVDGFIAHEVQDVVPEAITGKKDAVDDEGNPVYQAIDQSKLVPLLTAALQEAITKIESLEARIAALEA